MYKYIESHIYAWNILTEIKLQGFVDINVTGFEKNQQNCDRRSIPFIGPANSYTHTLPIHSAITRLDQLVYISRSSFANCVNS